LVSQHGENNEKLEGIDVWGACGEFGLPGSLWLALLALAQLYGWTPAGTSPPDPEYFEFDGLGRDGSYFPPHGQRVAPEDAQDFATALDRALLDIPEHANESQDPFAAWYEPSTSVMQRLGGIKPSLRGLITHCRKCGELWLC
jgi:hypothetical protein